MQTFIAISKRLLYATITLLFLSLVTFLADEMAPGDQATVLAGEKATQATVSRLREDLGLNRPWPVRYAEFVGKAARFDFGNSYYGTKEPVAKVVKKNLPMTVTIASLSICLAAFIGIVLGTIAGSKENKGTDRTILILSTLGVTIPTFVLSPIFVIVFSQNLDLLPGQWKADRVAPDFFYLLMPILVLSARPAAQITRLCRASIIEALQQEYTKLAIAKGVTRSRLIFRHALRNAILPVITSIGSNFGILLTGSFIVEQAFLLPGIGREAIEAIQKGDTPLIQATTLLAGAMFVFVNLTVDLLVPILDPRVREAQV